MKNTKHKRTRFIKVSEKRDWFNHPAYLGYASKDTGISRNGVFYSQFIKQGFDDSVTWSLDSMIVKFITPRLKRFYELSDKTVDLDCHSGLREAIEIMITGFELASSDGNYSGEELQKIQDAWDKLAKYHNHLWW